MTKKKYYILIILSIIIISLIGTLAWLTWKSKETALVLTVGDIDGTRVVLKPYVINESLVPTLTYDSNEAVDIKATNNGKEASRVTIYYDIDEIAKELLIDSFKYTILKSTDNGSNYSLYEEGNFVTATTSDNFIIIEEVIPKDIEYNYKVYMWLDGNNSNSLDAQGKVFKAELGAEITDGTLITARDLTNKANPETLTYAEATDSQKAEMWTFSHEATEQTGALTDYRYIGNMPNNYIIYNNETWRIIGVFNKKIKIIKDSSIGNLDWDYKKTGIGSSTDDNGSSDWTDSQIMYMLNPTTYKLKTGYTLDGSYIKDASGNIIYQVGCQPASIAVGATSYSCTNNTWSLSDEALSQIDEVTYYLGYGVFTSAVRSYTRERSKTVPTGREINWNGYVGLMYPSDYGYTFANGVNDTCYNDIENCSTKMDKGGVPSSSWLFNSSYQFTFAPNYAYTVFGVSASGHMSAYRVNSETSVRPVVYLKTNTKLLGTGTGDDPYTIVSQ